MLQILLNPYVLVVVTTLLTASLVALYNRTLERDTSKVMKSFYKIAVIGTVTGLALVFVANRPEKTLSEPFFEDGGAGSF
jgi:hypothetical protein